MNKLDNCPVCGKYLYAPGVLLHYGQGTYTLNGQYICGDCKNWFFRIKFQKVGLKKRRKK